MFLDSLLQPRPSARRRWATLLSFTLELLCVAVLVLAPLFSTGALPALRLAAIGVPLPAPRRPAPRDHVELVKAPTELTATRQLQTPIRIPNGISKVPDPVPPGTDVSSDAICRTALCVEGGIPSTAASDQRTISVLLPRPPAAFNSNLPPPSPRLVSGGVMEGLLIHRVQPVYPQLAKAIRVQGTVELRAVVSKDGRVVGLQVVSGHPLLAQAAVDAVRQWRYRPFLLNGLPVEVEAQVTVNFRLTP